MEYAIVNAESVITEIGSEDEREEMASRTGHTRELVQLVREHSVGDEIEYSDRGVEVVAVRCADYDRGAYAARRDR